MLRQKRTVETTDRFLFLNAGLWGQLGAFGLTLTADTLTYDVSGTESAEQASLRVFVARFHAVAAYGFLRNQLCVGAGVRMAYLGISEQEGSLVSVSNVVGVGSTVVRMFGVAPQVGLIVKPEDKPFRLGLTARAPVSAAGDFNITNIITRPNTANAGEPTRVGVSKLVTPKEVTQPWEIEFGVAYQLGPRPLNPRWIDPHDHELELEQSITDARVRRLENQRVVMSQLPASTPLERFERARRLREMTKDEVTIREIEDAELKDAKRKLEAEREARYMNWPRERVTLLASVLMTGASTEAVALEGFIDQRRELVGNLVTMTPRFAVEAEAVPNLLKTRAGIYVEPSRFRDGSPREHFTVGFDLRVFQWSVFGLFPDHQWKISSFVDMAERYQNFGFSVGTWH